MNKNVSVNLRRQTARTYMVRTVKDNIDPRSYQGTIKMIHGKRMIISQT